MCDGKINTVISQESKQIDNKENKFGIAAEDAANKTEDDYGKLNKIGDFVSGRMESIIESQKPQPVNLVENAAGKVNDDYDEFSKNQDTITAFLEFLNNNIREDDQIKQYLDDNIKNLYQDDNFRHSYFAISAYLQSHRETSQKKAKPEETIPINENLIRMKKLIIRNQEYANIRKKLLKFIDHCNLELSRFSYFEQVYWKSESAQIEFQKVKGDYSKLNKKRKNFEDDMNALREELASSKSEYIAILSILAALILAGVGGVSLIGNVCAAISSLSNYRFLFVLSSFGFVLFNLSTALIYLIARLIKREITVTCNYSDGGDCLKGTCKKSCCGLLKIEKRFPFLFWFNVINLSIMISSASLEYLVMKYQIEDWLLILLAYLLVSLSVYYGIKNSKI